MTRPYQICTRCVMDTSDPEIRFNAQGVCNHCQAYDIVTAEHVLTGEAGQRKVAEVVTRIRQDGAGKPYDCIIGVSGGVDSTYLAYKVKELGLRPLAVHLDNGWDSELAVKNIEQTLKRLNIDLHTEVLDWEEFRDLQLAFLKASTPDSEIPSDHAILSLMYHMARKMGVRHVLPGRNYRTESHLPRAWSQGHMDWKYIQSVHQQFGTVPLKTFPHADFWTWFWYQRTMQATDLLNYLDYSKQAAMVVLEEKLGWKYYGGKHYESIYTRWYQGYWLPRKFGYDKRRMHMSSLICSGEMRREDALEALKAPTYDPALQEEDTAYVAKKFGLSETELEELLARPNKSYWDYPSYGRARRNPLFRAAARIYRAARWPGRTF